MILENKINKFLKSVIVKTINLCNCLVASFNLRWVKIETKKQENLTKLAMNRNSSVTAEVTLIFFFCIER